MTTGGTFTATYLDAATEPSFQTDVHLHAGPEALYTISGEVCLETPSGKMVGRAGGEALLIAGDRPMRLTSIGTEKRRSILGRPHRKAEGSPSTTYFIDSRVTAMNRKAIVFGIAVLAAIFAIPTVVLPAMRKHEAKACIERVFREHLETALRAMPAHGSNLPQSRAGFGGEPESNLPPPLPAWEASELCLREGKAKL